MYAYRKMLALDEIHKTKGKICSYVLKCDGDAAHPYYIYCGYTKDVEYRMLQHTGAAPGGAKWTAVHPPVELVSLRIHETPEEAMAAECANWNLWAGRLRDYDRVRGGRLNGVDPLKFAPRGWRPDTENTPPQ